MRIAAYPGSFDPPTVAHLAVAESALDALGVGRVDLVISTDPLGKDADRQVRTADRLAVLTTIADARPWVGVATTTLRLIADIAAGYDAVIMGADKWAQVLDPAWYGGSIEARDHALAGLPAVGVAPRATDGTTATAPGLVPAGLVVVELDLHPSHRTVSATSARAGRRDWMTGEAAEFDERTGAWSDPDRYRRWIDADPAHDHDRRPTAPD